MSAITTSVIVCASVFAGAIFGMFLHSHLPKQHLSEDSKRVVKLTINFISIGLFAPRNATVITTLFLCAVAVSGAIFLIVEMYSPFQGLVHISSAPLRNVLAHMGK
jgi:hypothetical protein